MQALHLGGSLEKGVVPVLAPCLGQLTALTLLSLRHNWFKEAGLAALVPSFARLTALRDLNLEDCGIGVEGTSQLLPSLGEALGKLVSLTQLELSRNKLLETGAVALASGLPHLTALRHLNLFANDIGRAGIVALAPALMCMPSLRRLDLTWNPVNDDASTAWLMHNLHRCSELEQLKLECIGVGAVGAVALSSVLRSDLRSLQLLSLDNCPEIGHGGVFALAFALKGLVSLRCLEMGDVCGGRHPQGPNAAKTLANTLCDLTRLTRLDLRCNTAFGEAGAVAIADSLLGLTRLHHFGYNTCGARKGGMVALCRSLHGLSRIQYLSLSNNLRGDCSGIAAALGPTLQSLTALEDLCLTHNDLDEGVAVAMAPGLSRLSRLSCLYLEHNRFGDGGVALLGESLKVGRCQNVSHNHPCIMPIVRAVSAP